MERTFMSIDDTSVADAAPAAEARSAVSRRTLMKTAAGAGIAAATVGIVGVAHASGASKPSAGALAGAAPLTVGGHAGNTAAAAKAPLVVHVTDLAKGQLDVFTNGNRTTIHDSDLANRIAHAAS
jgi:hypothetical protein